MEDLHDSLDDRYNPLSLRNDCLCAYCDYCPYCDYHNYDSYTYTNDDGETEYEDFPICDMPSNDRNIYQSTNDITYWEALCERLRELNSPNLPIAHNKYMELLINNLEDR